MSAEANPRDPDRLDGVLLPEEQTTLFGHSIALADLRDRRAQGRLPSAVLLHGPKGIGKATLAFALTRDILSETGDESSARVAQQVASGSHPNLFVLRRQAKEGGGFYTVIRVEEIRALRERMRRTRGRAGHRIAVIDAIDDCNPNAANALLKLLEEPPADTVFLLISHRPGQLLPTIRSRCHEHALRPVSNADVGSVLDAAGIPPGEARETAIRVAGGRPRRAFEALALEEGAALSALTGWLANPAEAPNAAHLAVADALGFDWRRPEAAFARDMIGDWLVAEGRRAALAGPTARARLASAGDLWEKAQALFTDTETLNLDPRQTFVAVFDMILRHARNHAPVAAEG